MPFFTLTTDFGNQDHYVGAVKGKILSQIPQAVITDISNNVAPFGITQAAYLVKSSYRFFPTGTIHLIGIANEWISTTPSVAVEYEGHYFIATDNGIFSLIFDKAPYRVVALTVPFDAVHFTFVMLNQFVHAACRLAQGAPLDAIGKPLEKLNELAFPKQPINENHLKCSIIHIDHYQNIIVDLTYDQFQAIGKGRAFQLVLKGSFAINQIHQTYSQVDMGELVALFNSAGYLEIAQNRGNLAQILNLQLFEFVNIEFYDH